MDRNISGVTKYYNVLNALNGFRKVRARTEVCELCFQNECEHDLGTIKRKDGQIALSYWVEIAKMEAKDEMIWLPDDYCLPRFPIGGGFNPSIKYDILPRLNIPLTVVNVQDSVKVYTEGIETYVDLPRLKSKMTHYGYIYDEQFYIIKSFKNGSFMTSKSNFSQLSDMPDNEYIEGFLYIPRSTWPYDEFAKNVCAV